MIQESKNSFFTYELLISKNYHVKNSINVLRIDLFFLTRLKLFSYKADHIIRK